LKAASDRSTALFPKTFAILPFGLSQPHPPVLGQLSLLPSPFHPGSHFCSVAHIFGAVQAFKKGTPFVRAQRPSEVMPPTASGSAVPAASEEALSILSCTRHFAFKATKRVDAVVLLTVDPELKALVWMVLQDARFIL